MSPLVLVLAVAAGAAFQAQAGASAWPAHQAPGAAPQEPGEAPESFLRAEDHRIGRIAHRIATAARAFCPDPYPATGILFHHLAEYGVADRPLMIRAHGLDRGPGVLSVIEGSSAARAGLRAGDVILAVNGSAPHVGVTDRRNPRAGLEAAEALIEEQLRRGPAELLILRDGNPLPVRLDSEPGCPARIRLARSTQPNSFATGRYVILTTKVLDFVRSDDELAVIIGHELAHNILRHAERLEAQNVPRGMFRGFGKNASRIRATEEEADRLGIRLAWSAGYDVSAAIPFWRRFYAEYDGLQLFRTHPGLGARERLINETIKDLEPRPERPELGKGALPDR